MPRHPIRSARRGFTIVELLIVMVFVAILSGLTAPLVQRLIVRSKIEGIITNTASIMRSARYEAIRRSVPTVVMIDPATNEVIAFADVHGVLLNSPADGLFNPIGGQPLKQTDYELRRVGLPEGVEFESPTDTGIDSVDGFDNLGIPDPPNKQAIFRPDGSAVSAGALRFADYRQNYFEVRVAPATTARIQLRKWDGTAWLAKGEGDKTWEWQ